MRSIFVWHPVRFLIVFSLIAFTFGMVSVFIFSSVATDTLFDEECFPMLVLASSQEESSRELLDPVERSPERLRDVALDFAEKAGLRAQVDVLYQEQELEDFSTYIRRTRAAKKKGVQRRQVAPRNVRAAPSRMPAMRRKKEQWDPRFSSPIPRGSFWLSSPFGPRKKANGKWGFHHGIDMAANRGTPISAAGSGTVIEARWSKGYGKTVVIKHDERFTTRYAHMDRIDVRLGDRVCEGAKIGCVGATGYVRKMGGDGSHLHFEVRDRGKSCNPFYFLK